MTESAHRRSVTLTLGRIASLAGGRLVGPEDLELDGMAPLDEAGARALGFLALRRYTRLVAKSEAGAFLVSAELEGQLPADAPRVVVEEPYRALRAVLEGFFPPAAPSAAVHATAVIGRGVRLGRGVRVEPYVVLGDGVVLGDDVVVGAHSVIGARSTVGARTIVHPHVVTYEDTVIGSGVVLHSGVRVGSDGFGYTPVDGNPLKMPQVGRAVVEDGAEIGANTTIDRGSLGDTVVGRGVKIDNLVQIAHNVRVGAGTLIAALVGIAGSTRIGRGAWLGGRASAINHLEIGDGARVTFGSTVTRDVRAGETVSGYPARPHREHLRAQALVGRIAGLVERVERLEARIGGGPPPAPASQAEPM
ncbi:MAG: UDP-3-O-(3-hydroxymyristoyl)glucosamine N-acyltransferase [Gemmatimonadales bacterium]